MQSSAIAKNPIISVRNIVLVLIFIGIVAVSGQSIEIEGTVFPLHTLTFSVVGGLALLLMGMELMSAGLQKTAGHRLKRILQTLTKNRIMGALLGAFTTMIVQSSAAVTIMTVGFVNAGILSLERAIAVILGANIGTTVTAQIIAFPLDKYALVIIALGVLFYFFSNSERAKFIGEIIFGLGILFFGLGILKSALMPLQEYAFFRDALLFFSASPLYGVLAGLVITVLVQSSSVTTGIVIVLAASGLLTFESAVPIILGENIGTTVMANIASMKSSITAKKAARAHFIFNLFAVVIILLLLPLFNKIVLALTWPSADIARQIANAHTYFNIIGVLIFLPFISLIAKAASYLVPHKETEFGYLDESVLENADTALDQYQLAYQEVMQRIITEVTLLRDLIIRKKDLITSITQQREKTVRYLERMSVFISKINQLNLTQEQASRIPLAVTISGYLEKMEERIEDMTTIAAQRWERDQKFSKQGNEQLKQLFADVIDLLKQSKKGIKRSTDTIRGTILHESAQLHKKKLMVRNLSRMRKITNVEKLKDQEDYLDIVEHLDFLGKKCRDISITNV